MSKTRVIQLDERDAYWPAIRRAREILVMGGIVAIPTETVYGLAVSGVHEEGYSRLTAIKQRPKDKPFTVHLGRKSDVVRYVPGLTGASRRLAEKGWPGPLTLILPVPSEPVPPVVKQYGSSVSERLYHAGTIGLRCPDQRVVQDLLGDMDEPVVIPSANPARGKPACEAKQVLEAFDGTIDLILDGGRTRYGRSSTIVEIKNNQANVLRPGVFDERTIRRLLNINILFLCTGNTCRSPMAEGLAKKLLAERLKCHVEDLVDSGVSVLSSGTWGIEGACSAPEAVDVCKKRGINISNTRSRPLSVELANRSDIIYAMTERHREMVISLVPSAGQKTLLLDPTGEDIADPVGGPVKAYETCLGRLETLIEDRLDEMIEGLPPSQGDGPRQNYREES